MNRKIKSFLLIAMLLPVMACGKDDFEEVKPAPSPVSAPSEEPKEDTGITLEGAAPDKGACVVLLMDKSGSMAHSDTERFAIEGAKMFIDMEPTAPDVNIGLVEFSNVIKSTGLIALRQNQNKEYLKSILDEISYYGKAHTDTGKGLLEAVSVLDAADVDSPKAIILFTDGRTDIDVGTPDRTTEDSIKDVDAAVKMAGDKGYKIFCIGLNDNGSVDEGELERIAVATGGKHFIVDDVNNLPDFYDELFRLLNGLNYDPDEVEEFEADGDYHDVFFQIDDDNIMEANIVISSSKKIADVRLTGPDGNLVDLKDDERISYTRSTKYSLIKIRYPERGGWSISVKGVTGDHIKVSLVSNYDVSLAVNVDKTKARRDEPITVRAYLYNDNKAITDKIFYADMTGYISLTDTETGEEQTAEMRLGGEGQYLTVTFSLDKETVYDAYVHVEGKRFFRDSDKFTVTGVEPPAITVKAIETITLPVGKSEVYDLDHYFKDPDGNPLSYSASGSNHLVSAEVENSELKVSAIAKGTASLVISADNGSGRSADQRVQVICTGMAEDMGHALAGMAAFFLIVLLLLRFIRRRAKVKVMGIFKVSVDYVIPGDSPRLNFKHFDILAPIQISTIGKRRFTVEQLQKQMKGYYLNSEYGEEKRELFSECMDLIGKEASRVTIYGAKENYTLTFVNKSKKVKFIENRQVSDRTKCKLELNNDELGGSSLKKEIGIRFTDGGDKEGQINITYQMTN